MAPKVKREDLVVPYIHIPLKPAAGGTGVVTQSMPMAAMFMRNKLLSWFALISSIQAFLGELNGEPVPEGSQSAYLRVGLCLMGLVICYMELYLPNASSTLSKAAVETAAATTGA